MYKITIAELKKITKLLDKTSNLTYDQKFLPYSEIRSIEKAKKEAKELSQSLKNNYSI